MKTHTITTYNFNELSEEAKEKAIDYIRDNWHDLGNHVVEDVVESLKALQEHIGGSLDYSIGIVPDRGEFIKFDGYDKGSLEELDSAKEKYPLTGIYYDQGIIEALMDDDIEEVLNIVHTEVEYIYSDEGITEIIEANEYEFLQDGSVY